ncbi:ATP-dependent DNA helicase [Corynebacterium kutscheri]|uniref:ATP-dependent DNA helicase RecQ n=1 Tax=Corynebacterium kutscheri TaxID=35755 RepID=A0AB38VQG1_9CORY|nr:ATP-dependent DNA helicase RecQ [Corynebacterium kutscheri]VEH04498.1 ATP-dependent DNA helicase [Corynebacterium kutscheri]VEH80336.1 ATP-dependent DNA helicase [Corynebacterium kutscheri]
MNKTSDLVIDTSPVYRAEANQWLQKIAGEGTSLHQEQWEAIDALVNQRQRMLVVQRTGWGKTAVYFIAAKLLRTRGHGTTVIISPLLALMRNQIDAATRAGITAVTLNSTNITDWQETTAQIMNGTVDVLLISPERLNNPDFREQILPYLARLAGMIVVDEAHCISDWGHDFRPDYRRIKDLLAELAPHTPVLATTATANNRVVEDVLAQLGENTGLLRGGLDRTSLYLSVVCLSDTTQRPAWLATHLAELPGSGIIYCLTVAGAEDMAEALLLAGYQVAAYTGRTESGERERLEHALQYNELKALVATSALGMGFDKPDLGFVINVGAPSSPVSYYQQIGRAGRGTHRAEVILLPGAEDQAIWNYFSSLSFPAKPVVEQLLRVLAHADQPLSTIRLEPEVNLSRSMLEQVLKVLDVDGLVRRVRGGWISTHQELRYDEHRYRAIAIEREKEQQAMLDYIKTTQCRMLFLRQQLDDETALDRCGRCDNCTQQYQPSDIDTDTAQQITKHMSKPGVRISQRKMWPSGVAKKGKITGVGQGMALGRLNDIQRGSILRALLDQPWQPTNQWRDDPWLNQIVAVLSQWQWQQRPGCVIALGTVNKQRNQLLSDLAQAIAEIGALRYGGMLRVRPHANEVPAQNSAFRVLGLENHWDFGSYNQAAIGGEPVLLLCDIIDTGWSATVAAHAIAQEAGVEVLPFALASRT